MKRKTRSLFTLFLFLFSGGNLFLYAQSPRHSMQSLFAFQDLLQYPLIFPMNFYQSPIHIVHLGDSHLQSGYLGDTFRSTLSEACPLAGYGLVSPYSLAGTNSPEAYRYDSPQRWASCTLSYTQVCKPMSPCGIVLERHSTQPISFTFSSPSYPFDQVVLFREEHSPSLLPVGIASSLKKGETSYAGMVADTLTLVTPQNKVTLRSSSAPRSKVSYGGALLIKKSYIGSGDQAPLLYSQIGLNGAMYANFRREVFLEAITALHPRYLLISLGTNESLAPRFNKTEFKKQVEQLVEALQKAIPEVKLVLSTPAPNFKRGRYNLNSLRATEAIKEVATAYNLALIDLYEAVGGKEGAEEKFNEGGYYNRDGVHFTIEGYHRQGGFFAKELLNLLS